MWTFHTVFVLTSRGLNLRLIFVRPNPATQAKEYWTQRRNKVIAFPQWKHIIPCLKSVATLLLNMSEGPIHYPRNSSTYGVSVVCFLVLICCFGTGIGSVALVDVSCAPVCVSAAADGGWMVGCMHTIVLCCLSPVPFSVLHRWRHSPMQRLWGFQVTAQFLSGCLECLQQL